MFIGHLPAGYILTKSIQKKSKIKNYLFLGLIGSLLPDIDIFYFYFIDKRQHLHHDYWIHTPFYWLIIAFVSFGFIKLFRKPEFKIAALIFFSNIFLHLLLDTIVGKINWLFPLTNKSIYLFNVPAIYGHWVLNFIFHWTFLFEVAVIIIALIILIWKNM